MPLPPLFRRRTCRRATDCFEDRSRRPGAEHQHPKSAAGVLAGSAPGRHVCSPLRRDTYSKERHNSATGPICLDNGASRVRKCGSIAREVRGSALRPKSMKFGKETKTAWQRAAVAQAWEMSVAPNRRGECTTAKPDTKISEMDGGEAANELILGAASNTDADRQKEQLRSNDSGTGCRQQQPV